MFSFLYKYFILFYGAFFTLHVSQVYTEFDFVWIIYYWFWSNRDSSEFRISQHSTKWLCFHFGVKKFPCASKNRWKSQFSEATWTFPHSAQNKIRPTTDKARQRTESSWNIFFSVFLLSCWFWAWWAVRSLDLHDLKVLVSDRLRGTRRWVLREFQLDLNTFSENL